MMLPEDLYSKVRILKDEKRALKSVLRVQTERLLRYETALREIVDRAGASWARGRAEQALRLKEWKCGCFMPRRGYIVACRTCGTDAKAFDRNISRLKRSEKEFGSP